MPCRLWPCIRGSPYRVSPESQHAHLRPDVSTCNIFNMHNAFLSLINTTDPLVFGVLSVHGIGFVLPLSYWLDYATTPIANFKAADLRLTDRFYTLSVLPVMAVVYYGSYLSAYYAYRISPNRSISHTSKWINRITCK